MYRGNSHANTLMEKLTSIQSNKLKLVIFMIINKHSIFVTMHHTVMLKTMKMKILIIMRLT